MNTSRLISKFYNFNIAILSAQFIGKLYFDGHENTRRGRLVLMPGIFDVLDNERAFYVRYNGVHRYGRAEGRLCKGCHPTR
jgi:hypothetical protein